MRTKETDQTLLEKANLIKTMLSGRRRIYTPDEIELALAWLDYKIQTVQVSKIMRYSLTGRQTYGFLLGAIRQAYKEKKLIKDF